MESRAAFLSIPYGNGCLFVLRPELIGVTDDEMQKRAQQTLDPHRTRQVSQLATGCADYLLGLPPVGHS